MAWAYWQHPVSPPRSSNRTCGFPASGFPTSFIARHTVDGQFKLVSRDDTVAHTHLRLATELVPMLPNLNGVSRLIANHRSFASSQECQKSGSFAPPALPGINARTTLSDSRQACRAFHDIGVATSDQSGSPLITRTTFPTCRAHYPGGSSGCACRLLPRSCSLPQMAGGSASALSLSRPAQASLKLRPAGSLSRPRRPLSRGFSPAGYPTKPLVSYRTYRQLSVWNPPPLVIRAFRAHCHKETFKLRRGPNRHQPCNAWAVSSISASEL